LKKRRIIYTVDVDFTDQVPEVTIQLWADGIARGIEHNKDEVKNVEYDIQVRDLPEVERQARDPLDPHPNWPKVGEPKELPSGEDD
jgi:hypothetical protein